MMRQQRIYWKRQYLEDFRLKEKEDDQQQDGWMQLKKRLTSHSKA